MNLELADKRALVTGSSAGIGESIVKLLASEGATVIVHGRNRERAARVAAEIEASGGTASIALGDLSTDEGAEEVVRQVESGGAVDILINNAGFYEYTTWEDVKSEQWIQAFESDLLSAVRMIQAFLPAMRERGWGRVVNIGSGTGTQPFGEYPQYCAVKAAMLNMTVSLARSLKNTGITANIISPGLIRVPSLEKWYQDLAPSYGWGESWDEIEKGVVRDVLPNDVGHLGTPEDIAPAVALLASPLSRFVSGANWRVDGGAMIGIN